MNHFSELIRKNYAVYIFIIIIALLLSIYSILFVFYRNTNVIDERRMYQSLKRRNALKPDEIEKIMKNIKMMKNLRVNQ